MPFKNYNSAMNDYMKRRWQKRRSLAIDFLGGKCNHCGDTDRELLEFDHVDPATKVCNVARASSFSELRFWEEVRKCQLLCPPCHKRKTASQRVHSSTG